MAKTSVLPTDPQVRKAWSATVASDSIKEQYYARHIGPEKSLSLIVRKTDLEAGPGDEVTTTLVAKLRGAPVVGKEKLEGKEMRLDFATHKMRIDVMRQGVNVGTKMDQKRVDINLKATGRDRLKDYIAELYEEQFAACAAGSRGVGSEFQHLPLGYAGYANALRAPDAYHSFVGTVGDKAKNTLVASDKLSLATLNVLQLKAKKMLGSVSDGNAVKIQKIKREGKSFFVLVTGPEGVQDIRSDSGTAGWLEAQKALITKVGKEAELFQGGAGWFNGVIVDEVETCVKFSDYGAGGNVAAMRSVFCGANFMAVTHGTKGMTDGMSLELSEDSDDRGFEDIITFMMILGVDKTAYAGLDYGGITVDHAFTAAPGA